MSRVGLNPISIPDGVTVSVSGSNVNIKGPKGELNQKFDTDFKVNIEDNTLTVLGHLIRRDIRHYTGYTEL